MRLRPGERVDLMDLHLPRGRAATLVEAAGDGEALNFRLAEGLTPPPGLLSLPRVTLAVAMVKPHRWEWLLQKATELGMTRLLPLLTTRTQIRPKTSPRLRWQRIVQGAAEQSEGWHVPEVTEPMSLEAAVTWAKTEAQQPGPIRIAACVEDGPQRQGLWTWVQEADAKHITSRISSKAAPPTSQAESPVHGLAPSPPHWVLFFGPEGGWTPEERAAFDDAQWRRLSLGPRILKTETAALMALSLALGLATANE
jgi:16S rRNA (uracil1498-N3)-methyltransferase